MILILMGAPGSGKGTQGRLLSERFRIPYLASGDLLRRAIEQQSPLGAQVKQYVERGLYVPDEIMVPAAIDALAALHTECTTPGVVLDGFPRTREQAEALDRALSGEGRHVHRVLYLYVPKDVLVERLAGRWTCRNDGMTYNALTRPPRTPGVCDVCGQPLFQRLDDQPEMVEKRLTIYLERAVPMAAYYEQRGILAQIDGNRPPQDVAEALIAAVAAPRPTATTPVAP